MMALAGVELETLVSEPDALTTRPPPWALAWILQYDEKNRLSYAAALLIIFSAKLNQ